METAILTFSASLQGFETISTMLLFSGRRQLIASRFRRLVVVVGKPNLSGEISVTGLSTCSLVTRTDPRFNLS